MVKVTALYVQCSFDLRDDKQRKRGATAMSDCCRESAVSAVTSEDGNFYWRCGAHEGEVRPGVFAAVTEVPGR